MKMYNLIVKIIAETSHLTPNDRGEAIKMEVTSFSKKYAKRKAGKNKRILEKLLTRKGTIEMLLMEQVTPSYEAELCKVNKELKSYAIEQAASAIFRSRCNFAKDGEKCSSYFLSLEKKRYLEENMKCVITEHDGVSTNQTRILREETNFYKKTICIGCQCKVFLFARRPGKNFNRRTEAKL